MTRPIYEPDDSNDVASRSYEAARLLRRPASAPAMDEMFAAYGQMDVTGSVTGSTGGTIGVIATAAGNEYLTPDQSIITISNRVTVPAHRGLVGNVAGLYFMWARITSPDSWTLPLPIRFGSIADLTIAPGLLSAIGQEMWPDDDTIDGGDSMVCISAITMFREDSGDWVGMSGGHDFPIRIAPFMSSVNNGVTTTFEATVGLGFIKEETPF